MSQLITLNNVNDLEWLRDLYRSDWPTNVIGYNTVDNYLRWMQKDPQLKHVKIYTLPEVWRHSGLYLIVDRYQLMINTISSTAAATRDLCNAIRQLDWSLGYKVMCLPDPHFKTVLTLLEELQLQCQVVQLDVLQMQRDQALALEISCPSALEMRPLKITDAHIINDLWISRGAGTLEFIQRLIQYNCNIGIWTLDGKELIAWCVRCQCGLLGMLHVKEAWRGRGLAKLAIQEVAQQVAKMGDDIFTMVRVGNTNSLGLFQKLNFKTIGRTHLMWAKKEPDVELWSAALEDS